MMLDLLRGRDMVYFLSYEGWSLDNPTEDTGRERERTLISINSGLCGIWWSESTCVSKQAARVIL